MNLLQKLQGVELDPVSRVSAEDADYCLRQEKLFCDAVRLVKKTEAAMRQLYDEYKNDSPYSRDGYIELYNDIQRMEKHAADIRDRHINKVCNYFEEKYKVSLDATEIREKYKEAELERPTYQEILEDIFIQLEGFTFEEKALQEIKQKFSEHIRRRNPPEIKGTRLILHNYVFVDYEKDYSDRSGKKKIARLSFYARENFSSLFKALSHYETKGFEMTGYYGMILNGLTRYGSDPFIKYELGYNRVQALRIYKNGNVEVTFETYEQAQTFLKTYSLM